MKMFQGFMFGLFLLILAMACIGLPVRQNSQYIGKGILIQWTYHTRNFSPANDQHTGHYIGFRFNKLRN